MQYNDENRGKFQNDNRARQLIRFDGLQRGNITPTDIDGFTEVHDEAFVFVEIKYRDAQMPRGQELAYIRLVDRVQKSGAEAALFLCEQYVDDARQDVFLKEAVVRKIYHRGQWHDGDGRTYKEYYDAFLDWVDKQKEVSECRKPLEA